MKQTKITLIIFVIMCFAALSFLISMIKRHNRTESFDISATKSLSIALSGPLPSSTILLNKLNSINFYDEPNFAGNLLGSMQAGENSDKSSLDLIRTAKSIRIPDNILLQIFGREGQQMTYAGFAGIGIWQGPEWDITRCVVYFSPMTGSLQIVDNNLNAPEPVSDDWKDSDKNVISASNAEANLSNVPRLDAMSVFRLE